MTDAATSEAAASNADSMMASRESTLIFGSTPNTLFDSLGSAVESALHEGVSSLPFIESGADGGETEDIQQRGDVKLLSIMSKEYGDNLEVAGAYAEARVFAFPSSFTRRRRVRLTEAFLADQRSGAAGGGGEETKAGDEGVAGAQKGKGTGESIDKSSEPQKPVEAVLPFPKSRSDIPSSSDLSALEDECAALRVRLRSARRRGLDLTATLERTKSSHDDATAAASAAAAAGDGASNPDRSTHESVTAVAVGREGLKSLTSEARDLASKLDNDKALRSIDENFGGDDHTGEIVNREEMRLAERRRKAEESRPPTLEEDYKERTNSIKAGGASELDNVARLLGVGRGKKKRRQE